MEHSILFAQSLCVLKTKISGKVMNMTIGTVIYSISAEI